MTLPAQYAWLAAEPGPRMLLEALQLYGTLEAPGEASNPVIIAWADEVEDGMSTPYTRWAADFYNSDAIAFCGLWMAVIALRANPDRRPERNPPDKYLAAASWAAYGRPVAAAMLADILVFKRPGGHHVGLYAGEDKTHYHVLGANQSDTVNVTRIAKDRCIAIRRTPYLNLPANIRRIHLDPSGAVSVNEA